MVPRIVYSVECGLIQTENSGMYHNRKMARKNKYCTKCGYYPRPKSETSRHYCSSSVWISVIQIRINCSQNLNQTTSSIMMPCIIVNTVLFFFSFQEMIQWILSLEMHKWILLFIEIINTCNNEIKQLLLDTKWYFKFHMGYSNRWETASWTFISYTHTHTQLVTIK